ncbi:hypothetical protein X777_12288, partial [Ooceraea biroi]
VNKLLQCNVVYRISCADCDASYVGQTKRRLNTQITEHRNDIKKRTGSPSVISERRVNFDHEFKWDEVQIVDKEG